MVQWQLIFKKMLIGSHTQKILKQYQDMGVDVHTGRDIKDVWIYIFTYIIYIYIYIYIGKLYSRQYVWLRLIVKGHFN